MVKYTLKAETALASGPDTKTIDQNGFVMSEVAGVVTLSLGAFKGCEKKLSTALKKLLGVSLPKPGQASVKGEVAVLSVAASQWFVRFPEAEADMAASIHEIMGELAAITDQSDSWVEVILSGPNVHQKMERLSPINLSSDAFPVGSIARTSIEHLGVIIMRPEDDADGDSGGTRLLILSPRSSVGSFIHAFS